MIFNDTPIPGAHVVELEPISDGRGFFARTWCADEFRRKGLNPAMAQCSVSFNASRGTVRGMHYQVKPHAEAKLVRCTMGKLFDVIVDVRPDSPAFKQWFSVELSAENRRMIYIPEGVAHGFQTLEDSTEVSYQIAEFYHPDLGRGIRWNDPSFQVPWPLDVRIISERDRNYPDFSYE
ncbi:MAG: dTDP-4-dehydrorhamnose 3,5-epimerase [Betaproteobacteria bacterium]|nr:dTDP-4-dehydrorhamnose 3,5-epimerase [Betaproteobacteria bacterium]